MKIKDIDKRLKALYKLAQEIRGPFLEQAIWIELLVSDIIARHFCPEEERRSLFFSLVINRPLLSFRTKIDVFERILTLQYPDLLDAHPNLIAQLGKVRRFRNRIAHSHLDSSEDFLSKNVKDQIQLIFYKDGQKKKQVVTVHEINERLRECSRIVMALVEVQNEVVKRVSASTS